MADLATIRADRHLGIGASDANRIVKSDWLALYREKVGETEPEDLSCVFRVQLGIQTERFHLDWLGQHYATGPIDDVPDRKHYLGSPWIYCHLDGWAGNHDTFIEVKHSNGRATAREAAIYYMAQLQHQMMIMDRSWCWFSVIPGNDDPQLVRVDADADYQAQLLQMEQSFWWHVTNKVPPEITPTGTQAELQRVGAGIPIDGLKPYDMTGSNEWASLAADYKNNFDAARTFEEAKTTLKGMVPADASECSGHGLTIKRDKRGSLRFSA
jgi:hypothetical protein